MADPVNVWGPLLSYPYYLGSAAIAPTVDALGVTLDGTHTGYIYWNSTTSDPWIWTGAVWQLLSSSVATSANVVSIADIGTYFTGTDVEAALQELGHLVATGVTLDGVQTLTNKTLTAPTINDATIITPIVAAIKGVLGLVVASFVDVVSSVNGVTITSAATGNQAKIQGTGEAAGAGLIIEGTGTNSSIDINTTGAGDINLITVTGAVKVNGLGIQRTKILDTPITLVDSATDQAAYTSLTDAVLSTIKATHAIIRCHINFYTVTGGDSAYMRVRNGDSAHDGAGVIAAQVQSHTAENASPHNTNDVTLELDSSYQFDYRSASSGSPSNLTYQIYLLGYIYEQ